MINWLLATPGRVYVLATLLPLGTFFALLIAGGLRNICRPRRETNRLARVIFFFLGGHRPLKSGALLATGVIGLAAFLAMFSLVNYLNEVKTLSPVQIENRWAERTTWAHIGSDSEQKPSIRLELGYRIDHLTAIMFAMVTVIGTCIFAFSLGYMSDEKQEQVEDHVAHTVRPGRFGRFFMFLSLFCFSMLNLLIADNLFQVFVSWELVGVCSFFLIGFYFERPRAGLAANKAFIMNRIGDAGFLIGLCIVWVYFGTFNFQDLARDISSGGLPLSETLFTVAGLGIFLGCVGKSAQFPLQTWLPDAMEGPTPVSALIHAATMVAAGVYLVGRAYPLFNAQVLLVIAYTGCITLFIAATIALVMTDIKRVLAYSTVSQLGYMMLALGIGGWVAGLLHLLTHAFFKALLFLGSGSVIHGCHHEQEMTKMGGLWSKMRITALTMLIGVLAIAGTPLFSGWYSKDLILTKAMGYSDKFPEHLALFVVPLVTAGITAFYMFRMWLMTFAGAPRDAEVHEHAHESPWVMTIPLIILSLFSLGVAWGWPAWDPHASALAHQLEHSQPAQVHLDVTKENHLAGWLALGAAALGVALAVLIYGLKKISAEAMQAKFKPVHGFLVKKWLFDDLYTAVVVKPAILIGYGLSRFDKRTVSQEQAAVADAQVNPTSLDGFFSALGQSVVLFGRQLRSSQSGYIRRYVSVLVLVLVTIVTILMVLKA